MHTCSSYDNKQSKSSTLFGLGLNLNIGLSLNLGSTSNNDNTNDTLTWERNGLPLFYKSKLYFSNHEKTILKNLLKANKVPPTYFKEIWFIASGARRQMNNNPDYYDQLLNYYPSYIPSPYEALIDLDLHRSFPSESFFQKDENLQKLKNVLIAYSRRNITVGYCQGFNFIVGKLLMELESEEKVFWVFAQIIEEYFPPDYYTQIVGVILDSKTVYDHLMIALGIASLSEQNEMIIRNNIPIWLICVFALKINDNILYTIWNGFFINGMASLLTTIVFFLKLFQEKIPSQESILILSDYYTNELLLFNDLDKIRDKLYNNELEFTMESIEKLRMINRDSLHREFEMKKNRLLVRDDNKNIYINEAQCNLDWPLCIYDQKYRYELPEVFVFKTLEKANIIDDFYFNDCGKETGNERKYNLLKQVFSDPMILQVRVFNSLLIERRKHNCNSQDHFTFDVYRIMSHEDRDAYRSKLKVLFGMKKEEAKYSINQLIIKEQDTRDLWKVLDYSIQCIDVLKS